MSTLAADLAFDFTFPSPTTTPPPDCQDMSVDNLQGFVYSGPLLELPYSRGHMRSASKASSIYSTVSAVESNADSVATHLTTPPRNSPPSRQHGPALLPKIRSQDQEINAYASAPAHAHYLDTTPPPQAVRRHVSHARSFTNPESLNNVAYAHMSPFGGYSTASVDLNADNVSSNAVAPLLCSPASFARHEAPYRRSSIACTVEVADKPEYNPYHHMAMVTGPMHPSGSADFSYQTYTPRSASPLSVAAVPETSPAPAPSTTLMTYLTAPNPAASLVRSISFPMRDPNIKHFWWDVRNIQSWSSFNMSCILALPGAAALLNTSVPAPLLPQLSMTARHPESESALHHIYTSYYLPKLNAALAISSNRPIQLSAPSKPSGTVNDTLIIGNAVGESASAAVMFGGKPTARVVGLVRGFDRFNTGMRVEGNIKRVEYLRGLAAIHHAMREHGCRYGFILTEIELVLVRNGTETTPFFGELEVTSFPLATAATDSEAPESHSDAPVTACLALWALCQIAGNDKLSGNAHWKSEIGAPAEGTRRKARARDSWIPQPQLAEKREAKRSRGWIWPEDAIGRKEIGKRGVKYGNF